jgi:hypothetical protein
VGGAGKGGVRLGPGFGWARLSDAGKPNTGAAVRRAGGTGGGGVAARGNDE